MAWQAKRVAPSNTRATYKRREKTSEEKREKGKGDWLRQRALIARQVGGADLRGRNVSVQTNTPTRRASRFRRPATHEEREKGEKKMDMNSQQRGRPSRPTHAE